jgi:transposase
MMGVKERTFTPLSDVSLDDLVPADHFYRHLERTLDLAFVRDLVAPYYAAGGRPSIDPIVFFKLHLILFFEGLRSERQLVRVAADRLSIRWYLGYDLSEPLPDRSSLVKIRERYGLETFRGFFEAIVERCQEAGLVWGQELYADATQVDANASLDSVKPRFAVEAHLQALFSADDQPEADTANTDGAAGVPPAGAPLLPTAASVEVSTANAQRQDWIARAGQPPREVTHGHYQRVADLNVSTTDPDATHMRRKGGGVHLGFHTHTLVDGGKARIILAALVTPAEVMENQPFLDLLWRARFRWRLWPRQVTGDTTYGTAEIIKAIEEAGLRAYVPLPDWDTRTPYFGKGAFRYDAARDVYLCPGDAALPFRYPKHTEHVLIYRADAATCNACALKTRCTASSEGRLVSRDVDEAYLDRVRTYHETAAYEKAMGKRKVWVEPLYAEAKDWHGLRRFRLRGLQKVNGEALLTTSGQNLKRLLSRRGWGRRPWPDGTPGLRCVAPHQPYLVPT